MWEGYSSSDNSYQRIDKLIEYVKEYAKATDKKIDRLTREVVRLRRWRKKVIGA
jgi:hypothetical protein